MLDRTRIQGFGSEKPDEEKPGFFGSLKDSVGGPAMRSAIDSVSLKFGDALEDFKEEMDRPWTPLQDISEMAQEIKSFVTGAVGIEQTAGGQEATDEDEQNKEAGVSPRNRCEAMNLISKYCQGYKAARVAPTSEELAHLWVRCNILQPNAVASVIYDQLSFSNGELEWQPRLRILYFLEVLYWKGGHSQDIAQGIYNHASGLLEHLATEVPQTKEKAKQVLETLAGNVSEVPAVMKNVETAEANIPDVVKAQEAAAKSASEPAAATAVAAEAAKAQVAKPPPQDLLDLTPSSAPSSASSSSAPPAKAAAPVDLLGGDVVATAPPVVDLISVMNAKEAAASPSKPATEDAFDPNNATGSLPNLLGLDFSGSSGSRSGAGGTAVETCSCGNAFEPDAKFCRKCGAQRPEARCRSCNAPFGEDAAFCSKCGSRRQAPEAPPMLALCSGMAPLGGGMGAMGGGGLPSSGHAGYHSGPPARPLGFTGPGVMPGALARTAGGPSVVPGQLSLMNTNAMGALGGSQPQRSNNIPTPLEVQSMQSEGPADPFAFAEQMMQDFTAGNLHKPALQRGLLD